MNFQNGTYDFISKKYSYFPIMKEVIGKYKKINKLFLFGFIQCLLFFLHNSMDNMDLFSLI